MDLNKLNSNLKGKSNHKKSRSIAQDINQLNETKENKNLEQYKQNHIKIIIPSKKLNSDTSLLSPLYKNQSTFQNLCSIKKKLNNDIKLSDALSNFNLNYDQLIHNLKHKKEFLNVFNEDTGGISIPNNHIPRSKNLQVTKKSSKILPKLSTSKLNAILDESFEYSYREKDNFQDLSIFFTSEVFKKYSMLPKKEFCLPKQKIKIEDEVFFDVIHGIKKLLIIDLVDTIVRVKSESYDDSVVEEVMNELETNYSLHVGENELQIQLRPGLMHFLNKIKNKYHIVVFTSSSKNYAEPILKFIDENNYYFCMKLYQSYCTKISNGKEGYYIKDLRIFENFDQIIHNIVCVDDDLMSFAFNIENSVPIIPFSQNSCCYSSDDDELWFLEKFLTDLYSVQDIRTEIATRRKSDFEDKLKKISKFIECLD